MNFMHHQRCEIDRRSVRVRLTEKGRDVRRVVSEAFARHAEALEDDAIVGAEGITAMNKALSRIERYWGEQIRYIY